MRPFSADDTRPVVESIPIGKRQRLVQQAFEIAAVVDLPGRRCVGDRFRRNEIPPSQIDRIDAELARRLVDQALRDVGRLLASGAAIGTDRRGVGQHQADLDVQQRNVIHQRKSVGRIAYGNMRAMARAIGADAVENGRLDGEKPAACVKRERGLDDGVARMIVGKEMLAARSRPLHRPSEQPRRMQHGNVFRIRLLLASECAADIGGPDPHLLPRHAEDVLAQHAVEEVRALAGGDQREAFVAGIVGADAAARLDRIGEHAVVDQLQPRHMRGPREGLLHGGAIAVTPGQRHVVRRLRPHRRGSFRDGTFDVRHRRQRLDLEADFLAGIERLRDRLRDDHDNRLADMPHPVLGQRGPWRVGGRIHREPAKREIRDGSRPRRRAYLRR